MDSSLIPSMYFSVWRQFKCVYSLTKIQSWTTIHSFFFGTVFSCIVFMNHALVSVWKPWHTVIREGTWASEKQMSSFSSSNVWLPAQLDLRLWSGCQKCQSREAFQAGGPAWESFMSIQDWLIKVTFALRLSKRMRPMGLVCVCMCVSSVELPVIPKFCSRQC